MAKLAIKAIQVLRYFKSYFIAITYQLKPLIQSFAPKLDEDKSKDLKK